MLISNRFLLSTLPSLPVFSLSTHSKSIIYTQVHDKQTGERRPCAFLVFENETTRKHVITSSLYTLLAHVRVPVNVKQMSDQRFAYLLLITNALIHVYDMIKKINTVTETWVTVVPMSLFATYVVNSNLQSATAYILLYIIHRRWW